jgi:hypothetical protein
MLNLHVNSRQQHNDGVDKAGYKSMPEHPTNNKQRTLKEVPLAIGYSRESQVLISKEPWISS